MAASKQQKLLAASTAILIAEPAFALAHGGGVGVIMGLAAGAAAYVFSDDLVKLTGGGNTPPPAASAPASGKPSWAYRMLNGKSVRQHRQEEQGPSNAADAQETLHLGPVLRPHANWVLSNRVNILGMPGQGKSNLMGVLAEELARFDTPLVIFDHKPEYAQLCQRPFFTTPHRADASYLTPENAYDFGIQIMNERLQVVLNLRSFKNDTRAAAVMTGIIDGIWAWEEEGDHRVPVTIMLDEAHYWLPEDESQATVSKIKQKETGLSPFHLLQQAFFTLVTGGRSFGMGCVIATQRPANIDKRAIAVNEWNFFLKATSPNDLKVYKDMGVDADMAAALSQGEAYVIGPSGLRGAFILRKKNSPDEARTPGLSDLKVTGQRRLHASVSISQTGNTERPGSSIIYRAVNGATGGSETQAPQPHFHLLEPAVNDPAEQETPPGATVNVNEHIRDTIQRLADIGKLTHAEIAKIVRLDGRKYGTYRQVCAEMGIRIEREA